MNGIVIVDKPAGWTSHDVVAKLRGALRGAPYNADKKTRVGHGGTLDPMATGVLPVFIGRATRASAFCENAEKEYIAGLRLGIVTDTQDITGNTLYTNDASKSAAEISSAELSAVLPAFIGAQKQTPPMYSAIKINGRKLYELARSGADVPRQARDVFISEIEILGNDNYDYLLRIVCSKGTYIRTLCHDVGAALGCGGTMCSLRRTRAGAFTIDMAHSLDEVLNALSSGAIETVIKPIDTIFPEYPAAKLDEATYHKCKNGAPCNAGQIADGKYRFYGPDNRFAFLGEVESGGIKILKSFFEAG